MTDDHELVMLDYLKNYYFGKNNERVKHWSAVERTQNKAVFNTNMGVER